MSTISGRKTTEAQSILVCIQTNHTVNDKSDMEFQTQEFYLKSRAEMEALFADHPEALDNTVKIAEQCQLDFDFRRDQAARFIKRLPTRIM